MKKVFFYGCLLLVYLHSYEQEVPVLCYHQIRQNTDGHDLAYTIAAEKFEKHMRMLADSGYHTISPDELYAHLTQGIRLPSKPIIISFDDNTLGHYLEAAPIMKAVGFKGVFFIMTVTIGKSGYMNATQIKALSMEGHHIENHSWDHPDFRHLLGDGWNVEVEVPRKTLENIVGKPVAYFAFPYGAWNEEAVRQLQKRGIKAAFQLSEKRSAPEPLYTIRRLMVPGSWSAATLDKQIKANFR